MAGALLWRLVLSMSAGPKKHDWNAVTLVGNVVLETANLIRTVRAAGQRPSRSRMSR